MKNTKFIIAVGIFALLSLSNHGYSQNWGFSLPFGGGGFAINKKNWVAGFNGTTVGGGRGGWGFQLPNGAGFYNGNGGGGACFNGGGGPAPYYNGGGSPAPCFDNWTGYGGYYSQTGWNYGPNYRPGPAGTTPVQYYRRWNNGAAVYRSANGQVWYQEPF